MRLRLALLIPLVLPMAPAVMHAQDATATRDDARWLENCREDRGHSERACEVIVETVPQAAARIVIEAPQNGAVEVRGWDRPEIEVHARIQAHAETIEEATRMVRGVRLDLSPDLIKSLDVEGEHSSVAFEVLVPRGSGLSVDTDNGPLKVEGLTSEMRLTTDNGPLALIGVGGDVHARATNGPLHVVLTGDRWQGAGLDAETVNGPVHVEVPDGYSAQLEIGTHNGHVVSEIPMTIRADDNDHRIHMQLGRGGPAVRVITTNGPVKIETSD